MKNKIKSLYLTLLLIFINFQNVYATGGIISSLEGTTGGATDTIKSFGGKAIAIASTIGAITSVVVLVIIGMKYIAGSADEKANYKETLTPYFIGAILVFAASSIAGVVYKFVT